MGNFDKTLGPVLIGIFVNTYLYGFVMFQFASYHNIRFNDPYWIKFPVGFLFVVDTFHSAVAIYLAWEFCVANYANPGALGVATWAYTFTPICTALIGFITHIFLGHRFFRLTKNKIAYFVTIVLSVLTFSLAMAAGIWALTNAISLNDILSSPPVYKSVVTSWLSLQTAQDAILAGSLGYSLSHCRPAFMAGESTNGRVLRGALQIGLFAFLFSLASLLGFLAGPSTSFYGMFAIPVGRVYSNVILDTLLSRKVIDSQTDEKPATRPTEDIWVPPAQTSSVSANSFSLHSIQVRTEVFSDAGRITPHSRTSNEFKVEKGEVV
ncbi:hypothetical protein BDZ94DRAFT_540496 [Collybia nuda]|uniref:DUF6534 domain-containing protein n=1 Tax=Collybia nuda TaxID=64659 RepID=A0A9P6CQL9_9AGAR|nr:hypothetical protein BDZ94DRAFT_540496 [Collybia nuda]